EDVYRQLQEAGIEILFDDRDESPGVKFNDADLIGAPIRLTIGGRSLDRGGVELKLRREKEIDLVPLDDIVSRVQSLRQQLFAELQARVIEVPFEE
ncbi:MAG TPA: His/Gly/Thr/Pro-type tRNA ligase C-terminal domain-containing protein, partial [Nitrososphaera sp.]|nr:His/Gly/Thr/Pro-type tRNA ligase C-terminal domain-containing protein [Nitrososphaera sp.]